MTYLKIHSLFNEKLKLLYHLSFYEFEMSAISLRCFATIILVIA